MSKFKQLREDHVKKSLLASSYPTELAGANELRRTSGKSMILSCSIVEALTTASSIPVRTPSSPSKLKKKPYIEILFFVPS